MTVALKNDYLTVQINEHGAELTSVKSNNNIEYVWQADPKVWGRHAPVLFPMVGRLKDDQFHVNGQSYPMGQHGFARDMDFEVLEHDDQHVILALNSNAETRAKYPFDFTLKLHFELNEHELTERYEVVNPMEKADLLFSIGGHPGFNVNLGDSQITLDNASLKVAPGKEYKQIPLKAPYIDPNHPQDFDGKQAMVLNHEMFKDDAIILELKHQSTTVMIENQINDHGVALNVENAPYIGIWSPYPAEAEFVCLEPWWGIADTVEFDGELKDKLGINRLAPQASFNEHFTMTFF